VACALADALGQVLTKCKKGGVASPTTPPFLFYELLLVGLLLGNYWVGKSAQFLDGYRYYIAILEEASRGAGLTYAAWCTGRDYVAWLECHQLAEERYQVVDLEDQHFGVRALQGLIANGEADIQYVWIAYFVGGGEGWAHWCKGVERFADGPLAGKHLEVTGADVVDWQVATYVVKRFFWLYVLGGFADYYAELGFVVYAV
jgi:hypothetical protein